MRLVDTFYKEDNRAHGLRPDGIDYNQFKIDDDGKTFCWTPGGGKKDPFDNDEGGGDAGLWLYHHRSENTEEMA